MSFGARVLLIDDDAFARNFLQSLIDELPKSGITLDWKGDFDGGLTALLSGQYNVCFLDYQLGEKSGLELLRVATAAGCRTPVIVLTGQGDHDTDVAATRAGAHDYVEKGSFDAKQFERMVRYAAQRGRQLESLRLNSERHLLAAQGANDGIWDWNIRTDELYLSPRWKSIIGYEEDALENRLESWFGRVHDEDVGRLKADLEAHSSGATAHFESEHRILHRDGTYRWVLVRGLAVRNATGAADRMAGSLSDVTQSRSRDSLTNLPNRVLFMDRLERSLARSRREEDYSFAVLFLDVDRFKVINDSLGHNAGDELLIGISARLEKCLRGIDTVARLGGDEYVVLLDGGREPDGPTRVAARMLESLSKPFIVQGKEVFTGASIGVAVAKPHYRKPEEVLRDADTAMHRAKALGRNRCVVFDPAMHERAVQFLQMESDLRKAVEGDQLEVHFQPVVSVAARKLLGFEALIRWRHPTKGLIPPDRFIPLAEETGLIVAVDRWILKKSCLQMAQWHGRLKDGSHPFIAVNASKCEFEEDDYADFVIRTLSETKLLPSSLCIEITESAILDNSPKVTDTLRRLREAGIQIVMDDFGTGYSSLSYLQRFPFTGLKVDRSFVNQMQQAGSSLEVVRAIVTLGRSLGLRVTAEGVETESQLEALALLDCEQAQGYLFSKPVPADVAGGLFKI